MPWTTEEKNIFCYYLFGEKKIIQNCHKIDATQ